MHSTDPTLPLLRMKAYNDCAGICFSPPDVMFVLYGDGRVVYRKSTNDEPSLALLDSREIDDLLGFAVTDGGLAGFERESAFSALPSVSFEIHSRALTQRVSVLTPLDALLVDDSPEHQAVRRLAQRLVDFGDEIGDRRYAMPACDVTATSTIAKNDVVAWNQSIWQDTGAGAWVAPIDAFLADRLQTYVGFPSDDSSLKMLWWVDDAVDTLHVEIRRIPDGAGADLMVEVALEGDPGVLPRGRRDRPSGMPSLPPGCYQFSVEIGGRSGSVVEQVNL